jgi:ceramide glucosyltransferase
VIAATTRGWTLDRFANRHLRWAQMRRHLCVPGFVGELLLNPVAWFALAVLAAARGGLDPRLAACAGLAVAAKAAGDVAVSRRLGVPLSPVYVALIPAKDLIIAAIWAVAAFRRTVDWRGNRMRIGRGSELSPLTPADLLEDAAQEAA